MRRTVILLLLIVIGFSFFSSAKAVQIENPTGAKNIPELVKLITNGVKALIGSVSVIMFIIAGIFFLTAAGNQERIQTAKNYLIYAVIGLVIVLSADILAKTIGAFFE